MRFISSMSRCLRKNRFPKRQSRSKPSDEDSNDLINPTSETVSFAQGDRDSVNSSTNTIVRHSIDEPAQSTERTSSDNKLQSMANLSIQTLFDERLSSNPGSDKAVQALSMPEYPVLRLDTTAEPPDRPMKCLQKPLEPVGDQGQKATSASALFFETKRQKPSTFRKRPNSKQRMSMASRIKAALHTASSPKKLDSYSVAEGESWTDDEKPDRKDHKEREVRKRWTNFGFWDAEAVGRPWW